VLQLFRETTTSPLSKCVLQTPKQRAEPKEACPIANQEVALRKTPRIKEKSSTGKYIVRLAQDLMQRSGGGGVIPDDKALDYDLAVVN
jgi:hypothetical protein